MRHSSISAVETMSHDDPKRASLAVAEKVTREEAPAGGAEDRAGQVLRLFLAHHSRLVSYLTARVGQRQEAEDLAQKAYERMLSVDRDNTVSFLEHYLYKTASNLAINRLKQRAHTQRVESTAALESPKYSPSPEPVCIARERLELLERALQQLKPRVRMVFLLREFEDLSYEEIIARMAALDIRLDRYTAMRYVTRAIVYCRRYIEAEESIRGVKEAE